MRDQQPPVEGDVINHGKKVSAVLTPENVDIGTDERDNMGGIQ